MTSGPEAPDRGQGVSRTMPRTGTFWIGNPGDPVTRYVVFDGETSGYSPASASVPAFIRQLYPKDGYRVVFADDDVYVFRRG